MLQFLFIVIMDGKTLLHAAFLMVINIPKELAIKHIQYKRNFALFYLVLN